MTSDTHDPIAAIMAVTRQNEARAVALQSTADPIRAALTEFEDGLLDKVPTSDEWTAGAHRRARLMVAYVSAAGLVEFGVVGWVDRSGAEPLFDVSPAPLMWEQVPLSRIARVKRNEPF